MLVGNNFILDSVTYRLHWHELFLWDYPLTFVEIQTLLKVTRPVVLWLKEMVMMVSRRGSESNIKSDLSIWARYLFKHSLNIFMV